MKKISYFQLPVNADERRLNTLNRWWGFWRGFNSGHYPSPRPSPTGRGGVATDVQSGIDEFMKRRDANLPRPQAEGLRVSGSAAVKPVRYGYGRGAAVLEKYAVCLVVLICVHLCPSVVSAAGMTLENALQLSAEHHPRLRSSQARWQASEQRAIQAGLLPNPRLIFGAEAIPLEGNTALKPDYLVGVGQEIPLGNSRKISKEIAAAQRERESVRLSAIENEIRMKIHGAFATALHAQASEELIQERIRIRESRAAIAAARVVAGDDIPESEEIAHADLDHEQLDYEEAVALRNKAFAGLVLAIGKEELNIEKVTGDLEMELGIEELQVAATRLGQLPAVREVEWGAQIMELRTELARAERIPKLNLALLYRRRATIGQNALDVEAAVTIPLFNRRATTRALEFEAKASRTDSLFLRQQMKSSFASLLEDLNQALRRANHTSEEILPHREKVMARQKLLFESGETSRVTFDVARLELTTEQQHYLDTLREVHRLWSELLRFQPDPVN